MAERGKRAGRDREHQRSDDYPRLESEEAEDAERPRSHERPGDDPPPPPEDDLPSLLATLGAYLEQYAPEEVVVLLREELERREFKAYADGWRDAAAGYERALREARAGAGTSRPLRPVGRGSVIPFPGQRRQPEGAAPEEPPSDDRPRRRRTGEGGEVEGRRVEGGKASLDPKRPGSKVPTIPPDALTRRPRPTTPEGAPNED